MLYVYARDIRNLDINIVWGVVFNDSLDQASNTVHDIIGLNGWRLNNYPNRNEFKWYVHIINCVRVVGAVFYTNVNSLAAQRMRLLSILHFGLMVCPSLQYMNTSLWPSGSTVRMSRRSNANAVISRITLRNLFTVVSCQLSRLRLLLTAQAMKADDIDGRKTTEVSWEQ